MFTERGEPKGWRPEGTYTGRFSLPTIGRFDDRPSNNPYPAKAPDINQNFSEPPLIVKAMRQYEKNIFVDMKLLAGGDRTVIKNLVTSIRRYKAIMEELSQNVYVLPDDMSHILDEHDGKEEAYA